MFRYLTFTNKIELELLRLLLCDGLYDFENFLAVSRSLPYTIRVEVCDTPWTIKGSGKCSTVDLKFLS